MCPGKLLTFQWEKSNWSEIIDVLVCWFDVLKQWKMTGLRLSVFKKTQKNSRKENCSPLHPPKQFRLWIPVANEPFLLRWPSTCGTDYYGAAQGLLINDSNYPPTIAERLQKKPVCYITMTRKLSICPHVRQVTHLFID